jgi:hypothetical protein
MITIQTTGRPSKNERLTTILHNMRQGEAIVTNYFDAPRLANSISRTTKLKGLRLAVTTVGDRKTVIEAVPHTA